MSNLLLRVFGPSRTLSQTLSDHAPELSLPGRPLSLGLRIVKPVAVVLSDNHVKIPLVKREAFQVTADEMGKKNPKAKQAKMEQFYDNSLVQELINEAFSPRYGENSKGPLEAWNCPPRPHIVSTGQEISQRVDSVEPDQDS